jgi:hypothetical protein
VAEIEHIRVSNTKGSRTKSSVMEDLRIPKSRKVHTVEISGKSLKGHFGISTTGRCNGESLELLTHEIPKGSEPLDQRGSQSLILLRRRRTGVLGFWYFGISDTRSMRGQGIVASGFVKF